jgi:hypothetical protein
MVISYIIEENDKKQQQDRPCFGFFVLAELQTGADV